MNALSSKRTLITGAASGIGRAIAQRLAREGARLLISGRNTANLETLSRELAPAEVAVHRADLARQEDIELLAHRAQELFGALDILVHCAGVLATGSASAVPRDDIAALFNVNVLAPAQLNRLLLAQLIEAKGHVVFVNSRVAWLTRPNLSHYTATKTALKALADCLREETMGTGLRVTSVYPGRVATPMQVMQHASQGLHYRPEIYIQPEDIAEVVALALTMPATAEISDITVRHTAVPT